MNNDLFSQNHDHPLDPVEQETYQRIQDEMHHCELWQFDQAALVQRMKNEGKQKDECKQSGINNPSWFTHLFSIPIHYPVTATAACTAIILLVMAWSWSPHPVTHIQFISKNDQSLPVPLVWHTRLQWGYTISIPNDVHAVIQLNDGSEIQCAPETQIAFDWDHSRRIDMHAGKITVSASHIEGSQMKVITPLFDVVVVGTVFEVELTPKP